MKNSKFKVAVLCMLLILFVSVKTNAQTPTITKTSGFPVGANIPCYGIAYGASKYASITNSGDVYTSTDGNSWTKSATLGQTLNNIIFANSLFVVVGASGYIATSADAVTWTQRTSGTTNTLNDVQYLQSVFYAVGQNRTVLSSANGTTWSAVTVSVGTATDFLYQIAYGGGKYIISAGSTVGQGPMTYQSTTGASSSWSTVGGFGVFGNTNLNKMAFLNGKFILITSSTAIFTSTDGASWTNITATMSVTLPNSTTTTVGNGNYFNTIYYDGTTYYWCGYSSYNNWGYGAIYTSTNLTALTLQSNPLSFVANKAYLLNSKHFIAGNEGLAVSTNGINYSFSNGSYNAMAYNGTTYVGVGYINSNGNTFSSTTFNSNTWTNRTLGSQKPLFSVVHDGTKFVAVGDRTVISSTDGNTWSSIATPAETFACLAYGGSKYVVGGYAIDYSSYFLKYSSDGITWTTASTANVTFFKVRYVNGAFYAMGIDNTYPSPASTGVIMRSTDGMTWANITPSNLAFNVYCYDDVTWDGTKYHFLGADAAYTFFTISTATPATTTSYANKGTISNMPSGVVVGSSYGEGAIAYSNGKFVATAIDGTSYAAYLVYSSNGTTWTTTALTDKSNINDIIIDNGKFRMIGSGDEKVTVEFITSTTWDGSTWSNGVPTSSLDAIIASSTVPSASFTCKSLTINSGVSLTTTGITATINGNIINNGNGMAGTGSLIIAASSTISGNAITFNGTLNVSAGTFTTGGLLKIAPSGKITGAYANITGTVTLQQSIIGQRGWRVFANPFSTTQTIATAAANNGITIGTTASSASSLTDSRTFSNATNTWSNVTGTTWGANTPYSLFIRGLATEVTGSTYTGGPTAFTYNVSGTLNGTSTSITPSSTANFLIAGNPYAAPVNTQALTGGTARPYYTYQIAVTGTPQVKAGSWVASGSNSNTTTTIPVLGVLAYQPSSTSTYNVTTSDINTSGTAATNLFGVNDTKQLELLVEQEGTYQDKLFVRLDAKATETGTDNLDLPKFYNDNVNLYTKSVDGTNLAIDARSTINSIPLGISALAGNYNFKVANNNLPEGSIVMLEDKFLNIKTELKTGTTYNFSITTDAASKGENRFVLNVMQKAIATIADATGFTAKVLGNVVNGNVTVQIAGSTTPITIKVVDVSGKTLKTFNAVNGINSIELGKVAAGITLLQISNGTNTVTEKVVSQ